ncbi:ATP-binding cassette sub-family G member 8 [Contarinia nasturtii]|uniref:ATP-binding cassette sub-family G member 8 n=1 Tax=Contarinia nasturtii TaxID=265458 RepID=UPI0012D45729|nr:ATP-binding cassette sub-family G member 8 [Contarinia nasturtii]XP_031632241.1 ATP-binding cassette sub-family G member 8 [Contarinia nasturtii]XP_031632242.1 ATP-binding cassette sub-family G member 8 [Contarinia nasturtii]XP_031632243.1 ATP-binding cassette sub-family G member 8 [Contarinia nasturtii]
MELNNMGYSSHHQRDRNERRYSVPQGPNAPIIPAASEDLHAWSIYRQNLNSDFTDSALGSSDKSPLPYGNFQLRDTTVQSILNHPRYGPKSPLSSNMYTYLKFGLPRVFPPNMSSQRSHRAGPGPGYKGHTNNGYRDSSGAISSGYDSSDNETTTHRGRNPPNKQIRKFRSESDFRAIGMGNSRPSPYMHSGANPSLSALRQHSRASIAGIHLHNQMNGGKHYGSTNYRSHSEADLLGGTSGHETIHDTIGRDYQRHMRHYVSDVPLSNLSPSRRQSAAMALVYPNIQVHCLDIEPNLRGVSFQAKAGDLFAVMATSSHEGTQLLETLAGLKDRTSGEILINGQRISQHGLKNLCSYVPAPEKCSLDPRMSVKSILNFYATLRGPNATINSKQQINVLIDDLGLSSVRASNISRLTQSEKQRLCVACQLLTDATVLILDQITTNMDIFDTFFLVEYLRQWCSNGKMVIMTLQPPTFEILSMCSGVLLMSGGRTVYSGSRSDLPRYMGSVGFPCPPFKNPADYYLDLVTLDDLSAAAMLESSARIETLANAWDQMNSEPPLAAPPTALPYFVRTAGFCGQFYALFKRFIIYKQPGSILSWISKLIVAAILSLLIGCIYWDVPSSDPQLKYNDRFGYHHSVMILGVFPLLFMTIKDIHTDRKYAEKDIALKFYGGTVYIITQVLLNLLPSLCIWLAYLLPAHSMSGLYSNSDENNIWQYIGYMLLFLTVLQILAHFCSHLVNTKMASSILLMLLIMAITTVGGYSVHIGEIASYLWWFESFSPQRWLLPIIIYNEFTQETLANTAGQQLCRNKHVQRQEIIVQHPCPIPNGTKVLADHWLLRENHILDSKDPESFTIIALSITWFVIFVLTCLVFITNVRKLFQKKSSKVKNS